MKILHITTHLNTGGITSYLLTLVREQVEAGHEVYVWASPGVRLKDFRALCKQVIHDVPRCKSELSPRLWARLPKLVSFLKKNQIDIIHTHTRVSQVLSAAAACFVKVPFVSTSHMFYKNRLGRRLFPCWGKVVIANSQTMRDGLFSIFGEKKLPPVTIARNGINVGKLRLAIEQADRQALRRAYGYGDEHIVVLSLSRLIPVKGIHILIDAFAAARKQVPDLRLFIAGIGEEAYIRKLKERVAELGIGEDVLFPGNLTEIEKPLKIADIFAAPYLWPEAFGLSILEAMTAGLPVIGSKSGGISELLGHGVHGLLFEEGSIPDLARCILDFAKDPDLRSRMGKASGQAALEYSSKNMYEQIQKVYENVIGAGQ